MRQTLRSQPQAGTQPPRLRLRSIAIRSCRKASRSRPQPGTASMPGKARPARCRTKRGRIRDTGFRYPSSFPPRRKHLPPSPGRRKKRPALQETLLAIYRGQELGDLMINDGRVIRGAADFLTQQLSVADSGPMSGHAHCTSVNPNPAATSR